LAFAQNGRQTATEAASVSPSLCCTCVRNGRFAVCFRARRARATCARATDTPAVNAGKAGFRWLSIRAASAAPWNWGP
jgi:hypothetical protein